MEYLEGQTLKRLIFGRPIETEQLLDLGCGEAVVQLTVTSGQTPAMPRLG
jgi:hypothetical protein